MAACSVGCLFLGCLLVAAQRVGHEADRNVEHCRPHGVPHVVGRDREEGRRRGQEGPGGLVEPRQVLVRPHHDQRERRRDDPGAVAEEEVVVQYKGRHHEAAGEGGRLGGAEALREQEDAGPEGVQPQQGELDHHQLGLQLGVDIDQGVGDHREARLDLGQGVNHRHDLVHTPLALLAAPARRRRQPPEGADDLHPGGDQGEVGEPVQGGQVLVVAAGEPPGVEAVGRQDRPQQP
mmetsp:Transcript_287/g.989  ORF Transcript_287/g.989 Transcript_287/m.989 type:complete len:235 (+) Transcript_287:149-853(+)